MNINEVKKQLLDEVKQSDEPRKLLRSPLMKQLYDHLRRSDASKKSELGKQVNGVRTSLMEAVDERENELSVVNLAPIDVTASMDVNSKKPELLSAKNGTVHPISQEIAYMADILQRMGFHYYESREIDDSYHMFDALNFPKGHPARDDYDTFMTTELDSNGDQFIAPAHTSTMQNRILRELKPNLEKGEVIAATSIDRVFRNEDLDARHEHTFYQHEGIYVSKDVEVGMLVTTLQTFLEDYFGKKIKVRINPFYFPFTEPSFEFSLTCPFCSESGCSICSQIGWIELLGCGMIHPNVLEDAGIDSKTYNGFAWGGGVERLIMMKHGVEDVRHFESGKLDFLKQFK